MLTSKIRKVISYSTYLAELLDGVWWRDKKMLKVLQHFWVLQSLLHCLWIFRGPHEINGVVYWNFEQATCVYLIIISTLELFHEKLFKELDLWKINLVVIFDEELDLWKISTLFRQSRTSPNWASIRFFQLSLRNF